ncbi:MAG TPA: porphobilinogen synthase [bacterium]|nr:porphobilinogen synthase [bacterium]
MKNSFGEFPKYRARRIRKSEAMRRLVRETRFSLEQLVMPYFVCEGRSIKEPIEAMPGQFRFSTDVLLTELEELRGLGVQAVLLFGIPDEKDEKASGAWSSDGIIQNAIRQIKDQFKDLIVMTDVCLCAYTSDGHCGLINSAGEVDNDASVKVLAKIALSHAEAGADVVAPSDMMDGRIGAIRDVLDQNGFESTAIMSYAAKYASAFYGPFRDAAHSAPAHGLHIPSDRKTYQMDPANLHEALREIATDIQEGADIVMVKPAMAYLDVIREASREFHFPLAAYSVSGEYAMIKAASERAMIDEKNAVLEFMTSLARAGAQIFITYHAKQIALWEKDSQSLSIYNKI